MAGETPVQRALRDAREGRLDAAIQSLRFLVQRQPSNLEAVQALGLLLTQAGQQGQAIHQLSRAVAVAPQVPAFRNNLANALMGAGRHAEAEEQCRKALEVDPRYERAWLGLALARSALGNADGAIEACERGLALRPAWPELARAYASVLESADRIDEAVGVLERAVAATPGDAELRARLLLALNYTDRGAESIAGAHRAYGLATGAAAARAIASPDPQRPIRIGVLSGDLRTHSVGYFVEPWIVAKPAGTTLVAFNASPPAADDPMQRRFRGLFDQWVEAAFLDDSALDRAIRDARIDVLVELSGHTAGSRLSALRGRPAPVIVSAIGYPNTTGHPAVDYRLVDSVTDPPGADGLATERLIRLDPCFLCYTPPADAPAAEAPTGPVTFGSFNLSTKVSERTLELWSGVLAAVPGSRLLVKSKALAGESARRHFLGRLAAAGVEGDRVELVAYTRGVAEHLALYGRVHVALDSAPYNGTTTTCEALWMGVPVVVLEGDRHASRVGASLLRAAGKGEWIARDAAEFREIAARLAREGAADAQRRRSVRDSLRASPLCDAASYSGRFHAAIRRAWAEICVEYSGSGPRAG
ncbi:MAG: hypothetical protein RL325_642 [Planctomycetota bacterium]